ncbi:hypothetical protein ABZS61_17250 [Streptomyces sp. NPDC005566]|uniref:hypothetical protein n=1 Tax=Streptomyces sp. NPDC005566 TaxID=3156886 RepID=UPI0033AC8A47
MSTLLPRTGRPARDRRPAATDAAANVYPREIEETLSDGLPKGATGKILKRDIVVPHQAYEG